MAHKKIKEVAGIFDDNSKLQEAIDELSISGFGRHEMSVIGGESAMKEKFNVSYKHPRFLIDNPEVPQGVNISEEEMGVAEGAVVGGGVLVGVVSALVAAGGVATNLSTPAAIIGATVGTAVGGVIAKWIGVAHAERLQKQIEAGGLVLWVLVVNKAKEKLACAILKKHAAKDVHIHSIAL